MVREGRGVLEVPSVQAIRLNQSDPEIQHCQGIPWHLELLEDPNHQGRPAVLSRPVCRTGQVFLVDRGDPLALVSRMLLVFPAYREIQAALCYSYQTHQAVPGAQEHQEVHGVLANPDEIPRHFPIPILPCR